MRGFTDGEGCFHVAINTNDTMAIKVQVLPEFSVIQHSRDTQILYKIKEFFGCGIVKRTKGEMMCYSVRNLKNLNDIIIPFFEKNTLITSKKFEFIKFRWIVKSMVEKKYHMSEYGLNKIRMVKGRMNRRIKEKDLIR